MIVDSRVPFNEVCPPTSDAVSASVYAESGESTLRSLMAGTALGDHTAYRGVYDLMAASVFGLSRRVVRDFAQAEEVSQEVMIEIWRRAAKFDASRGSARSWILTIAHARAVDRVRSAQSSRKRDNDYATTSYVPDTDVVAASFEAHAESLRTRRALADLSLVQREAIELAYYQGRTHVEIASILGVPVGTVKTRLRDGLIRLRKAIQAEDL